MSMELKARIERHTKLLELMLAQSETYHNHKETMAHAGIVLQIALVGGVLSVGDSLPGWVPENHHSARWIIAAAFLLLWLLIHIFIRWQLRNKRSAAVTNAVFLRTLRKWADTPPTNIDLKPYEVNTSEKPRARLFVDKYLIPIPAPVQMDVDKVGYPSGVAQEWTRLESDLRIGGAEWLLWSGSIFLLAMGLFRVFSFK